jgi:hypothetical protein
MANATSLEGVASALALMQSWLKNDRLFNYWDSANMLGEKLQS